tara:strand:- start:2248 stop:3624 length:1377 start_codon:yes stop_codon:yes gene_type:complete
MCGIIGIHSIHSKCNINDIIEGLICLQHRGQDSVGIANQFQVIKKIGLVKTAFQQSELDNMENNLCIGHVRYATNGSNIHDDIQPLYTIYPRRITFCHNGNIINIEYIRNVLKDNYNIIVKTNSDSHLLLYLYSCKIHEIISKNNCELSCDVLNMASDYIQDIVVGSFSLIIIIEDFGMVVIRDKNGIRPLIWGTNQKENIICSESSVLNILGHDVVRDVKPGENLVFKLDGNVSSHIYSNSLLTPCLFEYIYFARCDSIIDGINVLDSRIQIGQLIGNKIKNTLNYNDIDVIVPVPDTSITFANGIQDILKKPMRYGLIKNRYIDRTFIMKDGKMIRKNIHRKITGNEYVFKDKTVLIVDDSIVRGNTSKHIINIVKKFKPKKIIFASCSPVIRNTNQYGIYIPTKTELISYNKDVTEIQQELGVDHLIYNDLDSIIKTLKNINPKINGFETSMFKE